MEKVPQRIILLDEGSVNEAEALKIVDLAPPRSGMRLIRLLILIGHEKMHGSSAAKQ